MGAPQLDDPVGQNCFSPRQVSALLESIPEPAAVLADDLTILAVNTSYLLKFASSPEPVLGRHCHEVSHNSDLPCDEVGERCPIRQSCHSHAACHVIHEHFTPSGPVFEEISIYPLNDEPRGLTSFLEIVRPLPVVYGRAQEQRMVGESKSFRAAMGLIARVAGSDAPVLLLGESGTGKELAAQMVHRQSRRSGGRFVPVDCSALSENLFESELFGHEKGAFTGATHTKRGLVEAAAGGTLFLDEVGDVPLSQQVKLLRLLETATYRRVGSVEQRKADFRLVCATHRDLPGMVREGRFRRDLFFRISAFPIRLPPLRERLDDLPLLAERLLQQLNPKQPHRLAPESLELLATCSFPGNVRELLNILQRGCLLAENRVILPEHLPEECRDDATSTAGAPVTTEGRTRGGEIVELEELERRYLLWAAATFLGERRELADRLGVSERTLYRKLAQAGGD